MSNREHKLAGLKLSAATLKDCCSEAVVESVDRKVQDTVRAWANTESTLSELCGKYQRAVKLWTDYKTATDALTQLFEESVACLDTMDPNETFVHIEVSSYSSIGRLIKYFIEISVPSSISTNRTTRKRFQHIREN